jgi:hypothetical protein
MKILPSITLGIALASAGCAHMPSPQPDTSEPATAVPPLEGVLFSASGEPKGSDECFVRHEISYPEDIGPVIMSLELETEMKREDGNWMVVSWTEGIREELPSPDAVGRPGGGGIMHYIQMDELLLACDQLRFRVIVHACEPAPCPPVSADTRPGLFEVMVEDRSAN